MAQAIQQARTAVKVGEVPVGAILVYNNQIVVASHNSVEMLNDVTAHAEILAIKAGAQAIHNKYLDMCDLYVTMEPCPMCMYAISLAKIRRLYFGIHSDRNGAVESNKLLIDGHKPECYGGIESKECGKILTTFFANKRADRKDMND